MLAKYVFSICKLNLRNVQSKKVGYAEQAGETDLQNGEAGQTKVMR